MRVLRILARLAITCVLALAGMFFFILAAPLFSTLFATGMMGGMLVGFIAGSIVGSVLGCLLQDARRDCSVRMKTVSAIAALCVSGGGIIILLSTIKLPPARERVLFLLALTVVVPILSLVGFYLPVICGRHTEKTEKIGSTPDT